MGVSVFIIPEFYPLTNGGIGRVFYNMLFSMNEAERKNTVIIFTDTCISVDAASAIFPDVKFFNVVEQTNTVIPEYAFSSHPYHFLSYRVMLFLQSHLQEPVSYIEFCDWGGLAFCTLQEKLASGLFAEAAIAIRLHGSETCLGQFESHETSDKHLFLMDMERKCLRDCDLVIAQLPSLAQASAEWHQINYADIQDKLLICSPSVILDSGCSVDRSNLYSDDHAIMFTSKIQQFKRPDLFVRGVCGFLAQRPSFKGNVVFAAYDTGGHYSSYISRLVPHRLAERMTTSKLSGAIRERAIGASTVVLCSEFETFCLAAYEASLAGARVILNERNPAFGDGTPWFDGVNCFKFDGTCQGLTDALLRNANHARELSIVQPPVFGKPWESASDLRNTSHAKKLKVEQPLVSVIIPHYNMGRYISETLENVLRSRYTNLEVLIVDDGSTDLMSLAVIDSFVSAQDHRIKVIKLPGNLGLAGARNVGVRNAQGAYICTIDADDLIDPDFIGQGVQSLQNNSEYDVFTTPAAYFEDEDVCPTSGLPLQIRDYALFVGEAYYCGTLQNRYSTATAIFRAKVLKKFMYKEELSCYEDWSLYMRMVDKGVRFIISNIPYFFYRRRSTSMVHAHRSREVSEYQFSELLRTSMNSCKRRVRTHYLICTRKPDASYGAREIGIYISHYSNVPYMEALAVYTVRIAGRFHSFSPRLHGALVRSLRFVLRVAQKVRSARK